MSGLARRMQSSVAWVMLCPGRCSRRPVAAILAGSGAGHYRLGQAGPPPIGQQDDKHRYNVRMRELRRKSRIVGRPLGVTGTTRGTLAQRGRTGRTVRETGARREGKSPSDTEASLRLQIHTTLSVLVVGATSHSQDNVLRPLLSLYHSHTTSL